MPETASLINQAKRPISRVFRRFSVKRRQVSNGQFETSWQDLSRYVIRWGSYGSSIDTPRFGDLSFDNAAATVIFNARSCVSKQGSHIKLNRLVACGQTRNFLPIRRFL